MARVDSAVGGQGMTAEDTIEISYRNDEFFINWLDSRNFWHFLSFSGSFNQNLQNFSSSLIFSRNSDKFL